MSRLTNPGCTPEGENILRKQEIVGLLLDHIEQPKEGLFTLKPDRVKKMVDEIEQDGLIVPIEVTVVLGGGVPTMYEIIDGHHRHAAVKVLHERAVQAQDVDAIGRWTRITALIVDNLDTDEAKNYYRIKANLERNEYSDVEKAKYVAELNRLKPIVRKGNFSGQQDVSGQKDLVVNLPTKVVTGQGVKSPATQLQEKLGYSKGTMQARFKEWAKLSGYQGPMSSLDDIQGLADYCADYEARKKAKSQNKVSSEEAKKAQAKQKRIGENMDNLRRAFSELVADGVSFPDAVVDYFNTP